MRTAKLYFSRVFFPRRFPFLPHPDHHAPLMAQVLRSANIAQTLRAVNAKQGSLEVAPAAVSPSAAAVATPHTQSAQKLNHSAARRTLHQQHRAALDLQANALPVTETSSLVFVKDLLTTSFGSLAFLRGLFGDENFDNDTLYPNGEEPVDRGAGSTDKGPSGTPKKPIPVKKLKRGISVEVDTILDWIVSWALPLSKNGS